MFDWIVKISATAVVLSIVSYTLPTGKIRAAAMISLGFLFLSLIIFPLKDIISELGNKKQSIDLKKNILMSQLEKNDYSGYEEVLKVYKERLIKEISIAIRDKGYDLKDVNIAVNEDVSSSSLGTVQNVVASVCELAEENNENTIEDVNVPDIVIDRNGISIQEENVTESSENLREDEKEIKEIISAITGLEQKYIIIRWE